MHTPAEALCEPRATDLVAPVVGLRCCAVCGAAYRKDFARCPGDGGEIVAVDDDPLLGRALGQFVLDRLLGEGAMGRVYRAHHVHLGEKRYAVKVLFGDHATVATMRIRFAKEAEAVSRLAHPNVVAVADFGRTPEGLFYIAMELVDGVPLSALIDAGPLAPARAVRLAHGLCAGLAHAHERNLIHRDLKPDNVLVVDGPDGEVPRIVDFGIALATDREDARLTATGFTMGTPAYVAPEQAVLGKEVDHRADLYALGVTLYEMLTGELPFAGEAMEVVLAKATRDPPRLRDVPRDLEALVLRLLARDPDDRFADAPAVAAALARLSLASPPATAPVRRHRPRRRGVIVGAALAAIAVAAAAAWTVQRRARGDGPVAAAGAAPVAVAAAPAVAPPLTARDPAVASPGAAAVVEPRPAEAPPPGAAPVPARPSPAPARARPDHHRPATSPPATSTVAPPVDAPPPPAVVTPPPPAGVTPPAPARAAGVALAAVTADGAIGPAAARHSVERALPALRGCVGAAAPGAVTVRFTVDDSRRPRGVTASGGSAATRACVTAAVAGIRTDAVPDVGDAHVTVQVAFTP